LSEAEQKAAAEGLPTVWDTDEGANFKINLIKQSAQDQMRRIINIAKAEHHDTTALEAEYRRVFVGSKAAQQAKNAAGFEQTGSKLDVNHPAAQTQQRPMQPLEPEYVFGGT
jgi:hypothetical protein